MGVKTGTTASAGGCLAAQFEVGGVGVIVVYMGGEKTKDNDARFDEVPKLALWALETLD